jgi:sodium/bile acid cotransporter 7
MSGRLLGFFKKYWFLLGILAASALGLLLPQLAGRLNPRSLCSNGIVVVLFLITGLSLPTDAIWKGIRDVRLHLYLQLFIFALTPAYFLGSLFLLRGVLPATFNVGILALACLPTTVSSCVVFTQAAGGNAAGAMFSSTLANSLGVLVSPLLLSFLLRGAHYALPLSEVARILANLGLTILVPFAAGQGLRLLFARQFAARHRAALGVVSNSLILAIIFFAFGKSGRGELFHESAARLLLPFTYLALSHLLLVLGSYAGARLLGLSAGNRIAALFVAPQKTIAMGLPLLSSYFAGNPDLLAAAILPLLFYHPFQLLVAGVLRGSAWMDRVRAGTSAGGGAA